MRCTSDGMWMGPALETQWSVEMDIPQLHTGYVQSATPSFGLRCYSSRTSDRWRLAKAKPDFSPITTKNC